MMTFVRACKEYDGTASAGLQLERLKAIWENQSMPKAKKKKVVAVSGGFDPIHPGHVRMFQEAKKLGDELVVILNNDNWLRKKKGYSFMSESERKEVIEAFEVVDRVIISSHPANPANAEDMSVSADLRKLKPDIFANGGDRNAKNAADPNSSLYWDIATCAKHGIEIVYNRGVGGKIQSSSWLLANFLAATPCVCGSGKKYKDCHGKAPAKSAPKRPRRKLKLIAKQKQKSSR